MMHKKTSITNELKHEAEAQIKEMQKQIDYDTKDYTIELIVDKFNRKDFFVPKYQRRFIWLEKTRSLFIESILLGLPIPFMFLGDCDDGRMEIIDGAQRIQTIVAFKNNELCLTNLEKLSKLNNFEYKDLSEAQQRKFLNKTLRIVILEEKTPPNIRQDLFNRINTSGEPATDAEIRRGSYPGPFTTFIEECTKNKLFKKLCPVSEKREKRYERFELVLRFFAYLNNYENFIHDVNSFLDEFLINNLKTFNESTYRAEFEIMLNFVKKNFPNGFAKTPNANSTPRVRFEAIAVGTALALRSNPSLSVENIDWINSKEFENNTTTDASNNQGKLKKRIEYVRNQLLAR